MLEGPSGRYLPLLIHFAGSGALCVYCVFVYRPKYDDLLSNPTSDAQATGHTRAGAAYKAKVCLRHTVLATLPVTLRKYVAPAEMVNHATEGL